MLNAVLTIHAAATLFMTGLVWFVHVVHYPLFATVARAGDDHWKAYEREHLRRARLLIPPIMLLEAASAAALPFLVETKGQNSLAWLGLALLIVVHVSTFAGAVPMHKRLATGFDEPVHRRLMQFNLVRALAWTARSVIAVLLL
jgi:hypothetical protein